MWPSICEAPLCSSFPCLNGKCLINGSPQRQSHYCHNMSLFESKLQALVCAFKFSLEAGEPDLFTKLPFFLPERVCLRVALQLPGKTRMDVAALAMFQWSCWLLGVRWPGERLGGVWALMGVAGSGGRPVGGPGSHWGCTTPQSLCPVAAPTLPMGLLYPSPHCLRLGALTLLGTSKPSSSPAWKGALLVLSLMQR